MKSFNIMDKDSTKPEWNEVVREIPRMWELTDYEFHGETFTVPTPHNILPKPYGKGHPPIWVACGNPPTFKTAGEMGIGAIAFNFEPIFDLRGRIEAYKEGIANCTEPIGQFKNDNVMITNSVICCETREEARADRPARGPRLPRLDGEPLPRHDAEDAPTASPGRRSPCRSTTSCRRGIDGEELLDNLIEGGYMLVGTPDEVCEQIAAWGDVGMDQLAFGLPIEGLHHEEILATLELFGDKVIPEFDKDRKHSTDYYRETAAAEVRRLLQAVPRGRRVAHAAPRRGAQAHLLSLRSQGPCPATPPPPERRSCARRNGSSRGAGSTRSRSARSSRPPANATSRR